MAGHSKWHNIKIRKGAQDAKRGKLFTKAAREVIMAAKIGGGDPETNARLRLAIRQAKAVNMPNDNIDRAIKKGTGELDTGEVFEEAVFEGYGPHGVAIMVETLTDNRQRTVPELRNVFGKRGGNLGETGCVNWMFDRKGVINIDQQDADEDAILEATLETDVEDITDESDTWCVTCAPEAFEEVLNAIEAAAISVASSQVAMMPSATVELGEKEASAVLSLLDDLEDQDDVQNVHANFDIPEDVLAQLVV
jgi:YebC/PmpR family DNA-binding regulatory protein